MARSARQRLGLHLFHLEQRELVHFSRGAARATGPDLVATQACRTWPACLGIHAGTRSQPRWRALLAGHDVVDVAGQLGYLRADELSQVHNVLDSGRVGATELQHQIHELWERELFFALKKVLNEVDEAHDVDAHVLDHARGHRVQEQGLEFRLGDHHVAVCVQACGGEAFLQLCVNKLHVHVLLLNSGHAANYLNEHANQHIQHSEGRQQNKDNAEQAQPPVLEKDL
mmetsp:Transcript_16790/g.46215  ORF Transcript_16790/g.46215 Transcript_16790/m.46215 type:complete len:228 (+) Transcript_16790:111-794(+)